MRVIAGTFRSRPLLSPRGTLTRPTSDRLRETLFNILQPRIQAARFADLYAGTGAVGIEAISRGAAHVLFAERADPALANLRANLRSLGITSGFTLEPRSAISALDRALNLIPDRNPDLITDRNPDRNPDHTPDQPPDQPPDRAHTPDPRRPSPAALDIVFLDPPYEAAADYANTLALLGSHRAQPLLAPDALIVAEHSSKAPLPVSFGSLHQTRTLRQGDAALTFYAPAQRTPEQP